jgi:hypothetical protein
VPLLWRRRHPWRTLTVVVGIGVLWPAALAADLVAADMEWIYLVGVAAEFLALHAVATHGRPTEWTWLAPIGTSIAMSLSFGVAVGFGVRRDGALADTDSAVAAAALTAVVFGGGLFIITLLVWLSGFLPRHRRETTVTWEANAVAAALAAAQSAAAAERHRVFVGLRGEVLDRTAQVEAAAVRGELDTVVEQARAALAAMRGLLNGLRPVEPAQRDPQPGTAAVASLAERQRAAGRPVSVQVDGAPRALPADVDVSAYRLVELALGAGDGPATVRLEYGPSRLDLILTGVPAADDDHVGSGLRARVAAVGGTLRRTGPGAVHIRLPAPRPAPNEEVTPSASA